MKKGDGFRFLHTGFLQGRQEGFELAEYKNRSRKKLNEAVFSGYRNELNPYENLIPVSKKVFWNASVQRRMGNKKSKLKLVSSNQKKVLEGKLKLNQILPKEKKEVRDYPDLVGCVETDMAGPVDVGADWDRDDKNLMFSARSKKEKSRGKDEDKSSTMFGEDFDGKDKPFESGVVSFLYKKKDKKIRKFEVGEDKNEEATDDNIVFQYDQENKILEELSKKISKLSGKKAQEDVRSKKKLFARQLKGLLREENQIKEIVENKKDRNKEFYNELEALIKKFDSGKIKKSLTADEMAIRRRRIARGRNRKPMVVLIAINIIKELKKKLLKKLHDRKKVRKILRPLYAMLRLKSKIKIGTLLDKVKVIKEKYNIK